ncbi:MAG: DUF4418 family protein, partial [Clostridiales Family XIII bacterium]|nr:DUF4418 family protein [Clostridiales Family XIII bacterium]
MRNRIIGGVTAIVLGLLVSLGPTYIFKVCPHTGGAFMACHWTARAEIGVGMMISALGLLMIAVKSAGARLGFVAAIFLSGALELS